MAAENEETTLDLNQVMEEGMEKFQGELDEAAREPEVGDRKTEDGGHRSEVGGETTDESITPKPTDAAGPPGEERSEVGGQKSAEKTAPTDDKETEADEPGTQGDETPADQKTEDKGFRFKSQEEAESGYRHLQAAKTRVDKEAAQLRADLKKAQDAEERKKKQKEKDQELLEYMAERHEQALTEIDALDPDSEGYRKDVSRIWARKDVDIEAKRREQAEDQRSEDREQRSDAGDLKTDVWDDVTSQARAAEIDPEDDYFRMICTFAPTEDAEGKPMPMKDQIDWAITRTKQYHAKQEQQFQDKQQKAAEKKSEAHQDENLPLGRSAADRTALKPEKTPVVTLNDALESALEERRL